jgi:glycerol-1-phosphate dehydrogenase [NAD(P)+]
MNEEQISEALRDASDTENVVIGPGAVASVKRVFRESLGDAAVVVVADENTFGAAGEEAWRAFEEAGREMVEPYIFPRHPMLYADYGNIERLARFLREHDAVPVAVGAETLNDIVKRAAHEVGRSYLCVGTAASMDGYTSSPLSVLPHDMSSTALSSGGCW